MSFKLVYDHTGDTIPFNPINQELLEFYIDQLNCQSLNGFLPVQKNYGTKILDTIQEFHSCICDVNDWLYKLIGFKFHVYDTEEYLNQQVLNELHAQWAQTQFLIYDIQQKRKEFNYSGVAEQIHNSFPDNIQTPTLIEVLHKLNLSDQYYLLNAPYIHIIECMFDNIKYTVGDSWTKIADNPFSTSLLTNNLANIKISFQHLGRTLYNKFVNYDMKLEHNDENSFNELLGFVTISLQPAQTISLSPEYINWCKTHNKIPSGNFLNIGNIPNLYENLTNYRIIVFRNLLKNNKFSIHKG